MAINDGNLNKAMLKSKSQLESKNLVFMFNPKDLSFESTVKTADNPGARSTRSGRPRVSFSDIPPKKLVIKDIWFDSFESRLDVMETHLIDFIAAVTFSGNRERPPLYEFLWGRTYLDSCFIEQLSYRLTKFLPDGTPVRAVIETLALKETEKPSDDATQHRKSQANREADGRGKFAKK